MATTIHTVVVESDSELARLLDEHGEKPFILKRGDARWRVVLEADEDEELGANYDPEAVLRALDEAVGSWSGIDAERMIADVYRARAEGSRPPERP